jgi:hypothetical protein
VKIEEIVKQIPPPPIINLSEKERGVRADNRVANSEDINKRLIIDKFKNEKPEWKIEPLCQALNQPRGPILALVNQLCDWVGSRSVYVLKSAYLD